MILQLVALFTFFSLDAFANIPRVNMPPPSENSYRGPFLINPDGETREPSKVYLPTQYESRKSRPLVVLLHGFGANGEGQDRYLTMRYRVSKRGFILATPDGRATPPGTVAGGIDFSGKQFWNATNFCCDFARTGVDDVTYLNKLIDKIKATYKVDAKKIYLVGHSNGGFMANRLACEPGAKFAGIASLAGGGYLTPSECFRRQAIPYLQIHAVDDPIIKYEEAREYGAARPTVRQWIAKNGCQETPINGPDRDFTNIPGIDTASEIWNQCASGKEVALWTIKAHYAKDHNAHIPAFNWDYSDAVLDFLLRQSL